jgi:hypothetical protein
MILNYFRLLLMAFFCIGTLRPACEALAQVVRPGGPIGPGGPAARSQPAPALLKMRLEGDQVSADIVATPLQQVLEELAAHTGIIFEVAVPLNPPLSLKLYRVPLPEAIQRIVGINDSIVQYGQDISGHSRIQFVKIFPKGLKGQFAGLRYIGTGAPTKSAIDAPETMAEALKALTESKNVAAREKAVEVLAATPGDVSIQALTAALNDPADEVKVAAIEGLTRLGARSALPQIIQGFKHSHPAVRQSAVEAVAQLGTESNVRDLRPMAGDKDAAVAAAAALAVRKLSSKP